MNKSGTFGEWLRQQRTAAGMTQAEAGDGIGKKQGTISDIERGFGHRLSREEVKQLAVYLGADPEEAIRVAGFYSPPNEYDPMTERMFRRWRVLSQESRRMLADLADKLEAAA